MSYCLNPDCTNPDDPLNTNEQICYHCNTELVLQNRYRGIRLLGKGGFGKTFEVEDLFTTSSGQPNPRKVLKVLLNTSSKAVELFQREADVLSRLQHPGIPKVEPDNGYFTFYPQDSLEPLHCMVMEKIDGQNLEQWLTNQGNQPITQDRAIEWLSQMVEILSELHQNPIQQYLHRDIKPSNIMLRPSGKLVLIDFGAAREVTDTFLFKAGAGLSGTGVFSSGYTPPEQISGKAVPQSDFFALGRTIVHLLTGQHPKDLKEDAQTGKLIWRDYAPHISKPLADLIDYLIAPFPGQRPQSTQVIWQQLETLQFASSVTGISVIGQNHTDVCSTKKQRNNKQQSFTSKVERLKSIAIIFSLFGAFLVIGFRLSSPQIALAFHERGFDNREKGHLDNAELNYKLALVFDPDLAETYYNLGGIYEDKKDFNRARNAYQVAIQKKNLDKAYNNLARLYILDQKNSLAIPLLQKGLKLAKDNEVKYSLLKNLGWAQLGNARYSEAEVNLKAAINIKNNWAPAYCLLARVLQSQGKKEYALKSWEDCIKYANPNHPDEKILMGMAPRYLIAKHSRQ
ncbi:protein kinase [Anabaena sphaerica FACHB-251]|uniref:non-specific serine/threonine protein kinase n=1 Tax=Anabaena sphaerica FACHB-251 TaxID=2692883 RepID=A0A927A4U4_9NOST|nr:serine/threonine-protein kinase [Anabaena sphaerica]MBD2296945.1 protein kinase [Anabaena sphaerica FACHB-251]